ncbi:hypothetical protein OMAG_000642 [Candidatus Omnitrophus magneticus]|uniref:Uncharacterized protein n=1 Tax=Candidatus Omnitrophus magneticus TaxID=1609969 RepID=A0A0F0CTX9_9BACT|nr:hypothetical protein OMAG_000642 [Candidatus Omnitrophus magneticus]
MPLIMACHKYETGFSLLAYTAKAEISNFLKQSLERTSISPLARL